MIINTKQMIPLADANRNFSKVARAADQQGAVVILKHNVPKYAVVSFDHFEGLSKSEDERLESVAARILRENLPAFSELAK